ncbi:MAG: hypothetical protein CL946_00625 [Ectothiorhodospiraceae bacterium]|nr:hypothetical protein [Ectothiorhodospiraceae bacterium]
MNRDELVYRKDTKKEFETLIADIEKEVDAHQFRVLGKHDIQATLAEKGMQIPPYTIVEVCNGKFAHGVLTKEKEIGMMLPCRIAVYTDGDSNAVVMMKPEVMSQLMPAADLGDIPAEVERILIDVIEQAA